MDSKYVKSYQNLVQTVFKVYITGKKLLFYLSGRFDMHYCKSVKKV